MKNGIAKSVASPLKVTICIVGGKSVRNVRVLQSGVVLGTESDYAMIPCFHRRGPHTLLSVDN